jgi:F-type H+-transporting ATPase subunit gamma
MSETTATLRRRLDSAKELQSVVRTMKSLAASSIGQYARSVLALASYYRTIELGLGACLRADEPQSAVGAGAGRASPPVIGAVVFGSDQGLVGQFNDVVAQQAVKTLASLPGKARVWAVGRRVHARLIDAGLASPRIFEVPSSVEGITPLVANILTEIDARERGPAVTELHLIYNRSQQGATVAPVSERLLPLDDAWRRARASLPWPTKALPEMIGGGTKPLRALVRGYVFVSIFRASAESLASENASRLAAMERAEKNIDESLATLSVAFHRTRQGAIDEELFDVVSGFEALSTKATAPFSPR